MRRHSILTISATALIASTSGYAAEYLTVEQAQQAIFPGVTFSQVPVRLSADQVKVIEKRSGVRLRSPEVRVWRTSAGGWFFVDEVLGKHEFITYAAGLDAVGAVVGVEILTYKESYGDQVRNPQWRAQFTQKTVAAPLKLDDDIKNISGATLSCRHVMEGVKRLLLVHDLALRTSP